MASNVLWRYPVRLEECDAVFKALANEQRLKMMYLLYCVDDKVTVSEFASVFDDSRSNASRQLKILREAGLLEKTREGKWTYYRVNNLSDPFIAGIMEAISHIPRDLVDGEVKKCSCLVDQRSS